MPGYSPKIEIINHFDKLINRVDVDIEESLEKYNEKRILGEFNANNWDDIMDYWRGLFNIEYFDTIDTSKQNPTHKTLWSESTKVTDYLKQVRMISIEEFRKALEQTLEYYKVNLLRFKCEQTNDKNIDEPKSELFAEKFYFQVYFTQSKKTICPFSLFTFVTDFYMSPSEIDLLEKLINDEQEPFCMHVFDEKMVLMGLLYKRFIQNLMSDFPNHIINVSKEEVLNIESIRFEYDFIGVSLTNKSIDLSKLVNLYLLGSNLKIHTESVEIRIEGLVSLKNMSLGLYTAEAYSFSIRNLNSLKGFGLQISGVIDEPILAEFLDKLPTIEQLNLHGNLSYFNLDHLVNLNMLGLSDTINDDFNFELLKNLSYQLQELLISFRNDYESVIAKMFDGLLFSNLLEFTMYDCNVRSLKKKFIDQFPALLKLNINKCNLEMIEDGAFSNIKQLIHLDLGSNFLKTLEKTSFSQLTKLEELSLFNNLLESFEKDVISNMKNLRFLDLERNENLQLDSETLNCLNNLEGLGLEYFL